MATHVIRTVLDGLYFGEGPRWHDGRLWFSDMHDHRVVRTDLDGHAETVVTIAHDEPSGLGWLPDGRMLVVSMRRQAVLRVEPGYRARFDQRHARGGRRHGVRR